MKKIKWWYLFLTAFFYYPVLLKARIVTYAVVYLVPLVFFALHNRWLFGIIQRVRRSKVIYAFYAWVVICAASIAVPVLMGTNDFSYFTNAPMDILKFAYRSLFLLGVFEIYVSPEQDVELFMRYFIYSCCLYVLGTVVFLLVPGLKEFWIGVISISELDMTNIVKEYYLTRFGWSGFSGFSCTLWCSMGVIFTIYLIIAEHERKERYLRELIPLFLLLCGNMFYGRTGLVLSVCCVGVMMLYFLRRKPHYIVMAVVAVVLLAAALLVLKERSEQVRQWYDWCFSVVNNFLESGEVGTESLDILFGRMLFIPEFSTIILGDGKFTRPDGLYYMRTDSGFMRPMLFYGVFFMLIGFSIFFVMVLSMRNRRVLRRDPKVQLMIFNLLFIWALFELKGPVFYLMATYLLPVTLLMINKNEKENAA